MRQAVVCGLLLALTVLGGLACRIVHSGPRTKCKTPCFYMGQRVVSDEEEHVLAELSEAGIRKESFGYSVEGRPITGYIVGCGTKTVLLLGGLAGDEPGGETILNALVELLSANPDGAAGSKLIIIPGCNPDALESETPLNANGVDLNRNFPSSTWGERVIKGESLAACGSSAGSEPEVMAIIKAIETYPPEAVFSIHSSDDCVSFEGPGAYELAYQFSEFSLVPVQKKEAFPGSLGAYFGKDREIPYLGIDLAYRHKRRIIPPAEQDRLLGTIMQLVHYLVHGGTLEEQQIRREERLQKQAAQN